MTKVAKITMKDNGEVTVTFTIFPDAPSGPMTLPDDIVVQTVPSGQALEIVRQWLGL